MNFVTYILYSCAHSPGSDFGSLEASKGMCTSFHIFCRNLYKNVSGLITVRYVTETMSFNVVAYFLRSNCIKRIPLEEEALKAFEQDLEEWNAEQHEESDRYDNREIWSFPTCYNLTRLTPAMAEMIYEQKLAEAKNKSRSMGERVSSIQRLTLLPSVDLANVVSLIDAEDADWTTNILERLIRGTVYIDEVIFSYNIFIQDITLVFFIFRFKKYFDTRLSEFQSHSVDLSLTK